MAVLTDLFEDGKASGTGPRRRAYQLLCKTGASNGNSPSISGLKGG
jgi:hypothetical protein